MDTRDILARMKIIQDALDGLAKDIAFSAQASAPPIPPAPAAPKKLGNVLSRVGDTLFVDDLCPTCVGYYDMPMDTPGKMRMAVKEAGEQFAFLNLETNTPVPFPFNPRARISLRFGSSTQLRMVTRCDSYINMDTQGMTCRIYVENIN